MLGRCMCKGGIKHLLGKKGNNIQTAVFYQEIDIIRQKQAKMKETRTQNLFGTKGMMT